MARSIPARFLNCFLHCVRDSLEHHGKPDIIETIAQPLGFGFDVDLGSRDWWIGGHGEVMLQAPSFNRGLTGWWEDIEPKTFPDILSAELDRGNYVAVQTDWSSVPYGKYLGLHVALFKHLSADGSRYYILDRMAHRTERGFGPNMCGWVDADIFARAFQRRLSVFRYRINPPGPTWEEEFLRLLSSSVDNMTGSTGVYAPHMHIATGLGGIRYFAHAVRETIKPSYYRDKQLEFLFSVRFQDNIRTHLIGSRMLLSKAIRETLPTSMAERYVAIDNHLRFAINQWDELSRTMMTAGSDLSKLFFERVSEQVSNCGEAEEHLVMAIAAQLKKGA